MCRWFSTLELSLSIIVTALLAVCAHVGFVCILFFSVLPSLSASQEQDPLSLSTQLGLTLLFFAVAFVYPLLVLCGPFDALVSPVELEAVCLFSSCRVGTVSVV